MRKLGFAILLLSVLAVCPLSSFAQDDTPQLVLPIGHTSPVTSVAVSPDGKYVLSGSVDSTMKLWEVSTGREIRTFSIYNHSVTKVEFSPDGNYILSGSEIGCAISLTEVFSGKEFYKIGYKVTSLSFSPDGKYILISCYDKTLSVLQLLDTKTGKEIRTFSGHKGRINSIAFSPDGTYIASCSDDKTVRLWESATGHEVRQIAVIGSKKPPHAVAFSPNGKYILAGVNDKALKLWSVVTGQEVSIFSGYTGAILSIAFSPDSRYAVAGCADNSAKLYEVSTGRCICSLGHKGKVNAVTFSPDGKYIVSGSDDKTIKLWDTSKGHEIRSFNGYAKPIQLSIFSPDGQYVLSVPHGNTFALWDVFTGRNICIFSGHKGNVSSVAFSSDGRHIVSGSQDKTIRLWDTTNGQEIRLFFNNISGHKGAVNAVAFSPDGQYIISGSDDKTLKLWEVRTGKNVRTFFGHKKPISSVAFNPDGLYIFSGSLDSTIRKWDVSSGREVQCLAVLDSQVLKYPPVVESIALNSNGKFVLSGMNDGSARLWDFSTGQLLSQSIMNNGWVLSVAISPNGKYALSGGTNSKTPRLWDSSNGRDVHFFYGHESYLNSVKFSPDGKYILSGASDGTTRLWETETGKPVYIRIHVNLKDWIVSAPDGRFDGTPDGIKLLHYAKENKSIPLDSLFERFYTPNLITHVISGREVIHGTPDIRQGIQMPPLVRITSPTEGQVMKEKDIKVIVESVDQGGGIEDVRLYHNDKRITGDERGMKKSDKIQTKFTVSLVNGINTFKATAFSRDRTESHPYEIRLKVDIPKATSDLYIVAVGINKHKNCNYELDYCVPDAQAIIAVLSERGKSIFRNINQRNVFDDQATKAGIESALSHVAKDARPEDAFVFYYSGHGVINEVDENKPADFYLVPYDVTELYGDDIILDDKGFSATLLRDICQRIKSTKQLLIIDSCQSGKIVETFTMRGISEEKAIAHLARSAGITVISATQSEQYALEYKEISHGIFTYALLQGLEGKADGSPKDNIITVSELSGYVQAQIPELSKKYQGKPQYPNVYMRGQDFPIVMKKR